MKAAVLNAIQGTFSVEDIDISEPVDREVLVEIKASGLCHSDLHFAENDFGVPLPAVLGHELSGVVVAVGPQVREFAVGDHVVGALIQSCGRCHACIDGHTYRCTRPEETLRSPEQASRLSRNGEPITQVFGTGAFADHALIHENQLAKIPKELPFPQAAMLGCGTITGMGAILNTADVKPGDSVAVIGIGGVGLNVIAGAALAGATRIVAIDTEASKEELARKFGATHFINASNEDPVEQLHALIEEGVDHAVEVVGIKTTAEQAIKMTRKGGGAYLIGIHKPGGRIEVDVTLDLLMGQVSLKGVNMGSTNLKRDIPMYADLYLQGRLNLDDLISKEIGLDDINKGYEELKHGCIARNVITSF